MFLMEVETKNVVFFLLNLEKIICFFQVAELKWILAGFNKKLRN